MRVLYLFMVFALVIPLSAAETLSISIPDSLLKSGSATLDVSGSAEVKTMPDSVIINSSILTRDKKASRAFDDNQTRMADVLAKLQLMGVDKSKIATASLSVNPVYKQDNSGKIDYFSVSRYLRITQDDMSSISPILDALIDSGVEDIGSIQFVVKDLGERRKEAMDLAARECRTRAENLASAMGARITGISKISYNLGGVSNYVNNSNAYRESYNQVDNQMITPDAVSTAVVVYATYNIEYIGR